MQDLLAYTIFGLVTAAIYAIRSPGKDGQYESEYTSYLTERFDCDIVLSNGTFVVVPAVK